MNYSKVNTLTGWLVFAISMITYLGTVSPTASFWDCGEFILVANELQVGHPPGASFWLLLGRVFALFAPDRESISYMVNLMSVFSSAFTVLFTFWIVTRLGRKAWVGSKVEPDTFHTISLMFAGAVGALALNFSDSFWFNGVEAEVYAMSSFFTALVVWLILKWEARADEPDHLKWILLIAYVMGLSIGVHLLNLLCIPALALVYYFRKYNFSWTGFLTTFGISIFILIFLQYGVIQVTVDLAWWFERLFVGTANAAGRNISGFGMPYNTGGFVFSFLLIGSIIGLVWYSHQKKNVILNVAVLGTLMVYLGFSSYFVILIRSNVNPPIDQNNPEFLGNFAGYVKREQYGDRPLFRGPMYNASPIDYEPSGSKDILKKKGLDRYVDEGEKSRPKYSEKDKVLFPRMHSREHYNNPVFGYKNYVENKGSDGENPDDDKPKVSENLKFMFDYQFNHMYWRYFFWNFGGRENDQQEATVMAFPPSDIPESVKNDPTANHYFYLPFILGILGLIWQYNRNRNDAMIVGLLFLFTGLAIIVYLNQTPSQPRERDYSYVGSFQTFCIWIGLGVLFLIEALQKFLKNATPFVSGGLALIMVPFNLGIQNWKDHSRRGNYIAPDTAYNFLNSCEKNAILFTYGDNDTFPLWYLQEVEGVRTDVRVVNLSYLNTDWYVYQMKNEHFNDSPPLPITLEESLYEGEKNQIMSFRSTTIQLPIDKAAVVKNGVCSAEEAAYLPATLPWKVNAKGNNSYLERKDVVILNLINNVARNGWDRPIYFATTVAPSQFLGLQDYFRQEGLVYRLVPMVPDEATKRQGQGVLNKEVMYDCLANRFRYRGLDDTTTFFDYESRRMVNNLRTNFFRLANDYADGVENLENRNKMYEAMIARMGSTSDSARKIQTTVRANVERIKEYKEKAVEILTICEERTKAVPFEPYNLALLGKTWQGVGMADKGKEYLARCMNQSIDELQYEQKVQKEYSTNREMNLYTLQICFSAFIEAKDLENAQRVAEAFRDYNQDSKYIDYLNQMKSAAPTGPAASGGGQ